MKDHHNEKKRSKTNKFDIIASEFGSSKQPFNKEVDGSLFWVEEIDGGYEWFLSYLNNNNEQTKSSNEGKRVNYEMKLASSDSDIQIWDNTRDCSEVNNKQLMTAKKEPSLKEKLMCVLRNPYDQEEYEQLSQYVEEKPICRLLPLRHREISSALDCKTKSVLEDVPRSSRRKLRATQNERPRALNFLRMFRFWLEHVPNEDVFKPWLNDECLKVLPSTRK